tara:strand:- start:1408 stop:2856 length:1449 start_codon:yes stop_codon:yes gene_type:complete
MLSSIRKFSKSILGKIVIGLIAVAFVVGFGMGGSFSGKQNIVAEINNEKITSQEFVTYLQKVNITTDDIEKIGKSNLLQRILMNYISEKIISIESKKRGFQLTDRSLLNKLKDDKKFQKDGKFSEIKYEKFMISNNLTKPFYENIVRETEVKDQLLNFYSGGIKLPVFIINDLYKKENILKKINYINLTKIYEKNKISEKEIEDYYEKNKNSFQEIYKKFKYVKLSPEILVGEKIINEVFFKKIDDIENGILDGKSFNDITSEYKEKIKNTDFLNSKRTRKDGQTFESIDLNSFKEIFEIEDKNSPKFINHNNNYYLVEILDSKNELPNLKNQKLKDSIETQLKVIAQIEKIAKLIKDINDKKFVGNDIAKLAKKNNIAVNTLTIKNINDTSKFSLKLLKRIYEFGSGSIFVLPGDKENYLVTIVNEKDPVIDPNSDNYKKYMKKANAQYVAKIYKSYDKYINANYKIDIKSNVLKRIENSL